MRLYFDGKTNDRGMYVNYALFVDKDGNEYEIDREYTYYEVRDDGSYSSGWYGVYVWDGEKENFINNDDFFKDKRLMDLIIEDDADFERTKESKIGDGDYWITADACGTDLYDVEIE